MQMVSNSYGCNDSIIKVVIIKPAYTIYIPNAFTPNSDGLNDGFKAEGVGIAQFKLQVFDRWGKLIFESPDNSKGWDGKFNNVDIQEGVYAWKVAFVTRFGELGTQAGSVMVIR